MQTAGTVLAVAGGLGLSLAIALLAEELFFGQVFRLLVARQAPQVETVKGVKTV